MTVLKRILVGVSGTPSLDAKVDFTLDLAKRHDATVQLVDVVDVDRLGDIGPIPIGAGHFAGRMVAHRVKESHEISDKAVHHFTTRCEAAGVAVETMRHEGDPLAVIAGLWRYSDICVLGARGWFDHGVLDDPEEALGKVIATGVRPILAVSDTYRKIERVVILYNGALEAAKAMKHYVLHGLYPEIKKVTLLCMGHSKTGEEPAILLSDAARYLDAHGIEAEKVTLPSDTIIDSVIEYVHDKKFDLIVMGGSYHRVLLSKRFGRTTISIIRRANIPVFLSH